MIQTASDRSFQERRRDERVVLLGAEAERSWVVRTRERPWLRCSIRDWRAADDWLKDALGLVETRHSCAEWAARRLGLDRVTVLSVSAPLHATFARRLLEQMKPESASVPHLCTELLGWTTQTVTERLDRWTAYAALCPADGLPLWIMDAERDTLEPTLLAGDRLASAGIPVGLRVTPDVWFQFKSADKWDRCATRWKLAPVLSAAEHWDQSPSRKQAEHFVRAQAPGALPLFEEARASLPVNVNEPAAQDRARSAVEALLFAVLEAQPGSSGRFRMNEPLDFSFGTRPAEGDLIATDARLVVEIDGYHHFRAPDDYRRDRRKDALFQEHGWFVLRFLTEDVVRNLESVVQCIQYNLARRDTIRRGPQTP